MNKPEDVLAFALAKYPEKVQIVPISELATDLARRNERRPAYVTLSVPDEAVKQLRGPADSRDHWLLVHVPRDVGDRAESRLVLPGEVR